MISELERATIISTHPVHEHSDYGNMTIKNLLQTRKAGHTIGMLIAERRQKRSGDNHQDNMKRLTRRLKPYEGILADPFNTNRRLNITRLIASIDGGR